MPRLSSRNTRGRLSVALVSTLALALGGCGGHAKTTSAAGGFVPAAEAVCSHAQLLGSQLRPPRGQAGLVPFFDQALVIGRAEVAGLRALHAPPAKAAAYAAYLDGLDRAVAQLGSADEAAHAANLPRVSAIVLEASGLARANSEHARAIGLSSCAGRR